MSKARNDKTAELKLIDSQKLSGECSLGLLKGKTEIKPSKKSPGEVSYTRGETPNLSLSLPFVCARYSTEMFDVGINQLNVRLSSNYRA